MGSRCQNLGMGVPNCLSKKECVTDTMDPPNNRTGESVRTERAFP